MPAVALIDLDGTLCDHDKALQRDLTKIASPGYLPSQTFDPNLPDYMEERINLIRRQPGWWLNLERIESGFAMFDLLRKLGFCLHILSKGPSSKSLAWKEKVDWVRINVPDAHITLTEDKSLVYGKVLFDDYPPYAERWLKWCPRGLVIMPEHNYNRDFSHPNVVEYSGIIE